MIRLLSFFVCLFIFNTAAYAARIQVEVSGTLSSASGNDASGNPTTSDIIKVGDSFSYRFVFNETNNPEFGNNDLNAITGFSGHAGGFSFAGQTGQAITGGGTGNLFQVYNFTNTFSNNPANRNDFSLLISGGPESGEPLNYIQFVSHTGVDTIGNNALTRDKLPSSIPPGFGQLAFLFTGLGSGNQFNGQFLAIGALETITVTNLDNTPNVPIPGAVWLFGSGLVGLFGFKKRVPAAKN